jgi:mono/diheme cytochrome c family protein
VKRMAIPPLLTVLGSALLLTGCQQKMAHQPSYRPNAPSEFFKDGRSARPPVLGTVARRNLFVDDPHLDSGLRGTNDEASRLASLLGPREALALGALAKAVIDANVTARYHDTFPFPMTETNLKRGQERFNIYCAVCHDRLGSGNGMVVQRGFTKPPSLLTDYSRGLQYQGARVLLRNAPVGYIFEVITHGYGAMPSNAAQVPPRDRWNISGYVRALQMRAIPVPLRDLPAELRNQITKQLEDE